MQVEFATTVVSAMYPVFLATAMKVRREYEVRVGEYDTIWDLCGRIWEDMRAQDDMELQWEDTGGYRRSGQYETHVGRCGRIWQLSIRASLSIGDVFGRLYQC